VLPVSAWTLLGWAVLVVAGLSLSLFGRKLYRHMASRRAARRRADYVELVGDLVLAGGRGLRFLRRRRRDPLFREVVLEYLRFLRGSERGRLASIARSMGLVDQYRRELKASSKVRRVEAVEALGQIGDPEALEDLVVMLSDRQSEVRVQAAAALSHLDDERVIPNLLAAIDRSDDWTAIRIADIALRFGRAAVGPMTDYLLGAGRHRPLIARTLGLIGDPAAEQALLQVLDSLDDDLRMRAAAALGRCGTGRSVHRLLDLLTDPRWEVRAQAVVAVGKRGEPVAIPWLVRALADESWWVRHNAAAALIEVPGGRAALQGALESPDPYARDAAAAVLLTSGAAESAVSQLNAHDPTRRLAAHDLVSHLLDAGKEEYFRAMGLGDDQIRDIRGEH
jgi:HEAT repeat protein